MKKIVVFTGAGISAESGLKTFRDSGGLWEEYNIMDVATPEAWERNPRLVLEFYNKRKQQIATAIPNKAHFLIAELEKKYDVQVITQNIDDLHERAGSSNVLHLHGLITKSQSSISSELVYDIGFNDIMWGDKCEKGSQQRPHIVWFGEQVPNMDQAYLLTQQADIFIIVGTSLNVHPAAGIVHYSSKMTPKFLVDPADVRVTDIENLTIIKESASMGMERLVGKYL